MKCAIFNRFVTRLSLVLVIAAAAFAGGKASAQFGEMAGIGEAMQPEYLSRDITIFAQALKLDDTQRVIVEALFGDYQSAFEASRKNMTQRFEDMHEQLAVAGNDTPRVMKLIFTPIRQQIADRAAIGEQFLQNVKVVLTEDQAALWPAFERRMFREKNLSKGKLSGETLNLLDALRDANLDEPATQQVAPAVEAYEIALDAALRAREAAIMSPKNAMMASLEDSDLNQQLAEHKRQIGLSIAVRNVNDEHTERIAAALPASYVKPFLASALDRAYPRIYRETPVQRIFTAAKALEGVEAKVMQSVIDLETTMLAELDAANKMLLTTLRNFEPEEARQRAESFTRKTQNQPTEALVDPTREMFQKREEMLRSYVRQLQSLLTPAQFDQLPGGARWAEQPAEPHTPSSANHSQSGDPGNALPGKAAGDRNRSRKPIPTGNPEGAADTER